MIHDDEFYADLSKPVMIAAFSGWNDASRAASAAVEHLELSLDARQLVSFDPQEYYDFSVNRPTISLVDGITRRLEWPTTHMSVARPSGAGADLLFVRGPEPNFHWAAYCEEILDVARDTGVEQVVLLGAMHMRTHYRGAVPIAGTAYDEASAATLRVTDTRYEGPAGITSVLQDAFVRIGVPSVSYWAGVPFYLPWESWPPASLALLHRVETLLDIPLPVSAMSDQADEAHARAQETVANDPELQAFVSTLIEPSNNPLHDATGDDIAEEFQRYLRRRTDDGG